MKPYIKTSLSPGSGVVTYYLKESGVLDYLSQLGYVVHAHDIWWWSNLEDDLFKSVAALCLTL